MIVLIDSLGTGCFLAGSAVFFTRGIGLSGSQVGLGLSLAGIVGLIASATMGVLADHFGARRVCVLTTWVEAGLFACYPLVSSFPAFLLVVCLLGAAHFGTVPSWGVIVAGTMPAAARVRTRAHLHAVANAGLSFGTLLSVVPLALGTPAAFMSLPLVNAASFLVAGILVTRLPPVAASPRASGDPWFMAARDPWVLAVVAASTVLGLHSSLLQVGLPLWIVLQTTAPSSMVAVIMTLNTLLVIALQVPASRGTETWDGAARAGRRSGLLLAAACLGLGLSGSGPLAVVIVLLLVGTSLITAAELLQRASLWGLSYALAPAHRQGDYQGTFGLSRAGEHVLGPLLTATLVVELRFPGWTLLAALTVMASVLIVPAAVRAAKSSSVPEAVSEATP